MEIEWGNGKGKELKACVVYYLREGTTGAAFARGRTCQFRVGGAFDGEGAEDHCPRRSLHVFHVESPAREDMEGGGTGTTDGPGQSMSCRRRPLAAAASGPSAAPVRSISH